MKLIEVILIWLLFASSGYAQSSPNMIFIADDSINEPDHHFTSRLIIVDKNGFIHPKSTTVSIFEGNGNFGLIEVQLFDTLKKQFIIPRLEMTEDVFPDFLSKNPNVRDTFLNESIFFLPTELLKLNPGIYRARLKIFFSRYNVHIKDTYTNWSYFHIRP